MSKGKGRAERRTRTRNEKKFQKPLDKATKVWYNKYEKSGRKTAQTRKGLIMKKNTMNTILSLIATIDTPEAEAVRAELTAELAKGKAKADANRAVYDEIHNAVVKVLKSATAPVTAQELANETGYAKGKIVYGLTNYWADEVEKTEGKTNTYALKA